MTSCISKFACAVLALSALDAAAAVFAGEWKPLFNGKDLTGWKVIDGPQTSWQVENGLLYCSGAGGSWLSTDDEYADFELELEFRLPKGGNSGVFLRAPHERDPHRNGMEIQVLDDDAKQYAEILPWQHCGSIYGVVAAKPGAVKKAGEWQKYHIVCNGRKVQITLNDVLIVDANLDDHKDKEDGHPGLKRTTGYIGLQEHGTRLDYRNIRIRTPE